MKSVNLRPKDSPEYTAWAAMNQRCRYTNGKVYPNYGGRGIRIEFATFNDFFTHVGPRPSPKHSIDRIDNAGNYAPGNVRWATRREQNSNTSANVRYAFNGKNQTREEWARETGINTSTLQRRFALWSVEKALTTPVMTVSECGRMGCQKRWHDWRLRHLIPT